MSQDHILWNTVGTSDKLWGITHYGEKTVTFWGKRGAKLTYKLLDEYEALDLMNQKKKKGYVVTTFEAIEDITPNFKEEFDYGLTICVLGDGFHRMNG